MQFAFDFHHPSYNLQGPVCVCCNTSDESRHYNHCVAVWRMFFCTFSPVKTTIVSFLKRWKSPPSKKIQIPNSRLQIGIKPQAAFLFRFYFCPNFVYLLVSQWSVLMQSLWPFQMEGDNLEENIRNTVARMFMKSCADDGGGRKKGRKKREECGDKERR